jgi:hypothetical protein
MKLNQNLFDGKVAFNNNKKIKYLKQIYQQHSHRYHSSRWKSQSQLSTTCEPEAHPF